MEGIKEKMNRGLTINRIPNKSYTEFVTLAKEEFCFDYGLCLKHLLDVYKGFMPLEDEEVLARFEQLEQKIEVLEQKNEKKREVVPVRRCLDGSERR